MLWRMTRERDLFAAIVLSGMALVGCSATEPAEDAGEPMDAALADASGAGEDAAPPDEDAGDDAMVLIL